MKQLLIIQLDEPYFLFETLQVLEKYRASFREFQLTVLVKKSALEGLDTGFLPVQSNITTDAQSVLQKNFDLSVNLSLEEESWVLHAKISSTNKIGAYLENGQLIVNDNWSSYLLTLKGRAPFLTFQLQQIYQNILGIKAIHSPRTRDKTVNRIIFGSISVNLFSGAEQEKLVESINRAFPNVPIMDISEVDSISDFTQSVYIGPTSVLATQICEYGARGIFFTSHFQGFNLIPSGDGHFVFSSRGEKIQTGQVENLLRSIMRGENLAGETTCSVYVTDEENLFGGYLKSLNRSDENYPFYQSHVVLWNYLLNLFDTNLEVTKCSTAQTGLIQANQNVLTKLIRLYDYAMVAIDSIHSESKKSETDLAKVQQHMQSLIEVDAISDQISQSHSFLRPILDYYRIRRGQNHGTSLLEQSQHSFLMYSEEHQALQALNELFSVTLQKNEVNI